ncbi:MAG: hypothetical protein ABI699_01795 [Caldimonas sp.]
MATFNFVGSSRLLGLERASVEIINRGETSFQADLLSVYEGIQADRVAMLAQVRELQLAAQLLLDAEGRRIAAVAPGDDRAALLGASSRTILDRVELLDQELEVATVRVPLVKKTEALLHGRITDDASRAAGPVTVTLADENGRPVAGVPPVKVDSAGYYAIVVPADVAAKIPPDRKLSLVVSHGSESVPVGGAPVTLVAGAIKVQDVRLSGEALDTLKLRLSSKLDPRGPVAPRAAKAPAAKKAARSATSKPRPAR